MRDAGAEVLLLPPAEAVRDQADRQPHPPPGADRRRQGRHDRRGRDRRRVDGRCRGPDHWRDTHVRVRGPVVRGLQGAFAENWLEGTGEVLAGDDYLPDLEPVDGGGPMQLVRSSAKVGDTNAEALYYLAIASAQRSIELTAAYFVPRPAFTAGALATRPSAASTSGCWCPARTSTRASCASAGRASYDAAAGRRRARCSSTSRRCCTRRRSPSTAPGRPSGTVNFDNRSFQLHDEVTLGVWDERFAGRAARGVRARPRALGARSSRSAGAAARLRAARSARPRRPCSAASSDPPILRTVLERRHDASGPAPAAAPLAPVAAPRGATRCSPRSATPTRRSCGRCAPTATRSRSRSRCEALGMAGEYGGRLGRRPASSARRSTTAARDQWLLAGAVRARSRSGSTSSPSSRSAASAR